MATPRVFISSTCYDLKYIRENMKYFIKTVGYEPILSEDGDVFYNPRMHTQDSCLSEVGTCQMFVLIIGGRYGGEYKDLEKSITNMEYDEAIKSKIPVFALVESSVYAEHKVFNMNKKKNEKINAKDISYPSVDNTKVFEFIDEVRKNVINNAIFPFNDFTDIEMFLKKQWAGMMYFYLTQESESKRVSKLFESISEATQKIEYMTREIAINSGDNIIKLTIKLYDLISQEQIISDLGIWNIKLTPKKILENETLDIICNNKISIESNQEENENISITHGGPPYRCTKLKYKIMNDSYIKLRKSMERVIKENKMTVESYLKSEI